MILIKPDSASAWLTVITKLIKPRNTYWQLRSVGDEPSGVAACAAGGAMARKVLTTGRGAGRKCANHDSQNHKGRMPPSRVALWKTRLLRSVLHNPRGHQFQRFRCESLFDGSVFRRGTGGAVLEQVIQAGQFGSLKILIAAVL